MKPAEVTMRRRAESVTRAVLFIGIVTFVWLVVAGSISRFRAELEHGVSLPPSARDIQRCGGFWFHGFFEHRVITIFEMSTNDLPAFIAQLRIQSRLAPIRSNDGQIIWPERSSSLTQYNAFRRTWAGEATLVEMLGCSSSTGDWLHIDLWKLEGTSMLVKMYTDWN